MKKIKELLRTWLFKKEEALLKKKREKLKALIDEATKEKKNNELLKKAQYFLSAIRTDVFNSPRNPAEYHRLSRYLSLPEVVQLFIANQIELYQGGRRTGNSTRVADYSIQFLFHYGELHRNWLFYEGNKDEMKQHTFEIIRKRLFHEHHIHQYPEVLLNNSREFIKIDINKLHKNQ